MKTPTPGTHWLDHPKHIKWLWRVFIAVLVLTVLAEFAFSLHPKFQIEGWFGFHAIYGFIACALMVIGAKAMGLLLKRPDTYYREDRTDE